MLGMRIDLRKESVRLAMAGKEVPVELLVTAEDRYDHKKTEEWFKNNPNARQLGLALLNHLSPAAAQNLFEIHCRDSEEKRGKDLQAIKAKEKELTLVK
jgi:hypothetical protein